MENKAAICSAVVEKTSALCGKKARYQDQGQFFCGTHCRNSTTRVELKEEKKQRKSAGGEKKEKKNSGEKKEKKSSGEKKEKKEKKEKNVEPIYTFTEKEPVVYFKEENCSALSGKTKAPCHNKAGFIVDHKLYCGTHSRLKAGRYQLPQNPQKEKK